MASVPARHQASSQTTRESCLAASTRSVSHVPHRRHLLTDMEQMGARECVLLDTWCFWQKEFGGENNFEITNMEVCGGELMWKADSDAEISAPRAKREEKSSTLLHSQFLK